MARPLQLKLDQAAQRLQSAADHLLHTVAHAPAPAGAVVTAKVEGNLIFSKAFRLILHGTFQPFQSPDPGPTYWGLHAQDVRPEDRGRLPKEAWFSSDGWPVLVLGPNGPFGGVPAPQWVTVGRLVANAALARRRETDFAAADAAHRAELDRRKVTVEFLTTGTAADGRVCGQHIKVSGGGLPHPVPFVFTAGADGTHTLEPFPGIGPIDPADFKQDVHNEGHYPAPAEYDPARAAAAKALLAAAVSGVAQALMPNSPTADPTDFDGAAERRHKEVLAMQQRLVDALRPADPMAHQRHTEVLAALYRIQSAAERQAARQTTARF